MEGGANIGPLAGHWGGALSSSDIRPFKKGDPRTVLSGLTDDAIAAVTEAIESQIRKRAFLLDNTRVVRKSLAHMALDCANAPTDAISYAMWESDRIDAAIEDHLREDEAHYEAGHIPLDGQADPRCSFVEKFAQIEPGLGLICAVLFNNLPEPNRRVFIELFVHNRSHEQCISAGLASDADDLQQLVEGAMLAFHPEDTHPPGYGGPPLRPEE